MYKNYKLVTFMLNMNNGESETVEHLTGLTETEALMKLYDKMSTVGGNPQVKNIRVMLFNPNGNMVKIEELIKDSGEEGTPQN